MHIPTTDETIPIGYGQAIASFENFSASAIKVKIRNVSAWCPRSQIEIISKDPDEKLAIVQLPLWLAKDRGFDMDSHGPSEYRDKVDPKAVTMPEPNQNLASNGIYKVVTEHHGGALQVAIEFRIKTNARDANAFQGERLLSIKVGRDEQRRWGIDRIAGDNHGLGKIDRWTDKTIFAPWSKTPQWLKRTDPDSLVGNLLKIADRMAREQKLVIDNAIPACHGGILSVERLPKCLYCNHPLRDKEDIFYGYHKPCFEREDLTIDDKQADLLWFAEKQLGMRLLDCQKDMIRSMQARDYNLIPMGMKIQDRSIHDLITLRRKYFEQQAKTEESQGND